MNIIQTIKHKGILVLGLLFLLNSCVSDDGERGCNPEYMISVSINLNLPLYSQLLNGGGWAYIQGEGAGSRGLIVINTGTGYKAYDRNAPHICPTLDSTLEVQDDIKIYCPEDGAEWILLTGQPIKIADRAPRVYQAVRDGSILSVFN